MKLKNEVYDILKFVSMVVLPSLETLWLGLASIWGMPYGYEIGATIAAISVFLGALLKNSSAKYYKGDK